MMVRLPFSFWTCLYFVDLVVISISTMTIRRSVRRMRRLNAEIREIQNTPITFILEGQLYCTSSESSQAETIPLPRNWLLPRAWSDYDS